MTIAFARPSATQLIQDCSTQWCEYLANTAKSWLWRGRPSVVSLEDEELEISELRLQVARLERRIEKYRRAMRTLAAVARLWRAELAPNSLIEAYWRSLKNQCLLKVRGDSCANLLSHLATMATERFKLLSDECSESGISPPTFKFLYPDAKLFGCALFQPRGLVQASSAGIGDKSPEFAKKFLSFLKLACDKKTELAVSPEYSCPWPVLEEALCGGLRPSDGGLWVLGCESLAVSELPQLADRLPNCTLLFDSRVLKATETFLDPVALVFPHPDNDQRLVCALQFKTQIMGVRIPIERDNLVSGSYGYLVRNQGSSISLATLICSDALEFSFRGCLDDIKTSPYLLLHLQLNPEPRHSDFSNYRSEILRQRSRENEIISLNWAANTTIQADGENVRITEPHSALYTKSTELNLTDARLQSNHESGLYYFRWAQKHSGLYVANYNELCLFMRLTKPSQAESPAPTLSRSGPQDIEAFGWLSDRWSPLAEVEDCTQRLLSDHLLDPPNTVKTRMDLERFLCISAGELSKTEWAQPRFLDACQTGTDEILKRSTCCLNEAGHPQVRERMGRAQMLTDIFAKKVCFEEEGVERLADCRLTYDPDNPASNIHDADGPVGTGAYIGNFPSDAEAQRRRVRLEDLLAEGFHRTYVWYHSGTDIKCTRGDQSPTINGVRGDSLSIASTTRKE